MAEIDHVEESARALTTLTLYYALAELAEGGGFYDDGKARNTIIGICKRQAQKCLDEYDRHRAALQARGDDHGE